MTAGARGFAIGALLALVSQAARAEAAAGSRQAIRFGLRTGYSISQQVCAECANEDHPERPTTIRGSGRSISTLNAACRAATR